MARNNLQKDCIARWTFDDVDTDGARDILRDRSGHGYHGEIESGITTGIASPVGEAYDFDGEDGTQILVHEDEDNPIVDLNDGGSLSVFAIAKPDDVTDSRNNVITIEDDDSDKRFRMRYGGSGDRIEVFTDMFDSPTADTEPGKYHAIAATMMQDEVAIHVDGELKAREEVIDDDDLDDDDGYPVGEIVKIGNSTSSGRNHDGEIAWLGVWSRTLTNPEIQTLTAMSGRRVSQL